MNNECSDCRGIGNNPNHYEGKSITPELKAKCIIYEAFTLAIAIQVLKDQKWPNETTYDIKVEIFNPSEIIKAVALMKIRILYDFLHNPKSGDDFCLKKDFSKFFGSSLPQSFQSKTLKPVLSKKSINKFVAHLTNARITKPKCIPQPKFKNAKNAIIQDGIIIIEDVIKFISHIRNHEDFNDLDKRGKAYLKGLLEAKKRLDKEISKEKILKLLVRVFVDKEELDASISFYEELFNSKCKMRFQYPKAGLELAQIESVLLIAGTKDAREPFQNTKATFLVDNLDDFKDKLASSNATIIEQPKNVPTGRNMRVQHPDGTIFEYVEHNPQKTNNLF